MNYEQIENAVVVKETDRAFLVTVSFGDWARQDVWFPKSQIKLDDGKVFASSWILDQKALRVENELHHVNTVNA